METERLDVLVTALEALLPLIHQQILTARADLEAHTEAYEEVGGAEKADWLMGKERQDFIYVLCALQDLNTITKELRGILDPASKDDKPIPLPELYSLPRRS